MHEPQAEIKEPAVRDSFQKPLGENPSRPIQGFDRVQFHAVVELRLSFWPGITVIFYRPPIITRAYDTLLNANSGSSSFHTLSETPFVSFPIPLVRESSQDLRFRRLDCVNPDN